MFEFSFRRQNGQSRLLRLFAQVIVVSAVPGPPQVAKPNELLRRLGRANETIKPAWDFGGSFYLDVGEQ